MPLKAYPHWLERRRWGTCVLHQGTKARVYEKLILSLTNARRGQRELDIVVSFVLGDTTSEAGKMIELFVEEGYPWDVISELLDQDLPAYTTSLDAAPPGENVVLAAYSKKRRQWVAVHRAGDGEQVSAWAATECLARRLAGLQARQGPNARTARAHAANPGAPAKKPADESETESAEEWRILF